MNLTTLIRALLGISLILSLTSCFKEDEKIERHQPSGVAINTIAMGQYYTQQAYFDLGTNQMVKTNEKDLWDLAFDCSDGLEVRLNASKFMKASSHNDTAFFSITDTLGLQWHYDASSGNPDSLALSPWYQIQNSDTVFTSYTFFIDRGMDALGNKLGVKKVKLLGYKNGVFKVQFSNLNNSKFQIVEVTQQSEYNFVQIDLDGEMPTMTLEPPKEDWDLFFTQYTDILFTSEGDAFPYLVTGVLLNPYKVKAIRATDNSFESLSLEDAMSLNLSSAVNTIGYDWKYYNFNDAIYTVNTQQTYVIQDVEGFYYKLRFIGFYNQQGEKGYPQFEFQRL